MDKLNEVGVYKQIFNDILGINLPCTCIYESTGLLKHIQKNHPDCVKYIRIIPDVVSNPDYIGVIPREPMSIEIIKLYDKNIQVAVKLDIKNNYLYVASMYDVKPYKITTRLHSGRLKKFTR